MRAWHSWLGGERLSAERLGQGAPHGGGLDEQKTDLWNELFHCRVMAGLFNAASPQSGFLVVIAD
jgi:hypothetical protein